MTAIQILEKLGADASFNPSHLSDQDKVNIAKLSEDDPDFHAPLVLSHHHNDDEEDDKEESEEDETR